ncbi:Glutathione-regulated potassium-efflux system protein KefC [Vibrio stylophorae]|uniref:Glutathione-regulated potassium-efflux system protein KefC n=1 Tax=Vibrio stylophorae TaxID=659351 RepID=A0ABN8DSS8_9VIBR|nr:monovalent cation:proton antiporter-2 (CPA2) family protein [Vibrio stylophorae]CAH0533747.1 Glutathione-regulated potassium-efflux system protein KefC [Vibrio stylophorae]
MTSYFIQAFIYLLAAVIAVPLAKRFGLGSVLGYLIAGVVIGPVIGLVGSETNTIQHFAEFGVVMMLFLVGLELDPKTLWRMRHRLLGLGGLQVFLTTLLVTLIALQFGQNWRVALTIGFIFALSSTAIVLQTLNEKHLNRTEGGRSAFSVLLFQDIAVIPMLAIIPFLALPELVEQSQQLAQQASDAHSSLSLVANLPGWAHGLVVMLAISAVVVGGHFLSRPLLTFVANSGLREIFTATALMLVIGIAALMSVVGLSPALGTFLAGVVLANSEFRHELESNIDPFKGILLGLFFITVGAGIHFGLLFSQFFTIIGLTLGLMLLKIIILLPIGLLFRLRGVALWLFALSLGQAGEFGFVLLSFSAQSQVLSSDMSQTLSMVVALSMFLTPGLFIAFDKLIAPRFQAKENEREADDIDEQGTVIIAGVGRVGQIINRLLVANGVQTVVLDHEATQVDNLRKINTKSYFGDATRPDLLHTAGIDQAKLLIVAMDDQERSVELVRYVKHSHPNLAVWARAFDRGHAYMLRSVGADHIESETFHSALELGTTALCQLGFHPFQVEKQKQRFKTVEKQSSDALYEAWLDDSEGERFDNNYRKLFIELEETIRAAISQQADNHSRSVHGWTPPPKHYEEELADSAPIEESR